MLQKGRQKLALEHFTFDFIDFFHVFYVLWETAHMAELTAS